MTELILDQELPPYQVIACNYATDSTNRIHSDEVAATYGFSGGLVPGIGDYAYLTRPVVEVLGRAWLERGAMAVKLLKPLYDGETVCARGKVIGVNPVSLQLELCNAAGTVCAAATASLPASLPPLDPADYPARPLPAADERPSAELINLPAGMMLGSWEFRLNLAEAATKALEDFRDALPIYHGPEAVCHPAALLAEANQILVLNVVLGPWIHAASEVQHYALAEDGETLSLRGRIAESYHRRGHDFVTLDLAMFGRGDRPIVSIKHTAIVRLRHPA
jgi:hypothetical protein